MKGIFVYKGKKVTATSVVRTVLSNVDVSGGLVCEF